MLIYSVSLEQLEAIRRYTLSKFICDTTLGTVTIQPFPMILPNLALKNPRMTCSSFDELDLSSWNEPNLDNGEQQGKNDKLSTNFILINSIFLVEHEMTQWFPNENENSLDLLRQLQFTRPGDVCTDVLGIKTRTVNGASQTSFECPKGEIRGTDFPNFDSPNGNIQYHF